MKRDTRNYGKFHQRFAAGGLVRRPYEESIEQMLDNERMADIDRQGKGAPKEYELKRNRKESIQKGPLTSDEVDPNWRANMPEDI